jgi:hypothetical protein
VKWESVVDSKTGISTTIPTHHAPPSSILFQAREDGPREDARPQNTAIGTRAARIRAEGGGGLLRADAADVGAVAQRGTQSEARAGPREPSCARRGARDRRGGARTFVASSRSSAQKNTPTDFADFLRYLPYFNFDFRNDLELFFSVAITDSLT